MKIGRGILCASSILCSTILLSCGPHSLSHFRRYHFPVDARTLNNVRVDSFISKYFQIANCLVIEKSILRDADTFEQKHPPKNAVFADQSDSYPFHYHLKRSNLRMTIFGSKTIFMYDYYMRLFERKTHKRQIGGKFDRLLLTPTFFKSIPTIKISPLS